MVSLWVGTPWSSGYHARVSTWWACHLTHSLLSSKDGLGIKDQVGLILANVRHTCPGQELLHKWVQFRGVSQVLRFPCPGPWLRASSLQTLSMTRSWWGSLLYFSIPPRAGFFKGDPPSESDGLGEGACLFAGFPVQSATEGTCSSWPVGRHLLWLLVHPLLPENQWLPDQCWLLHCPWEIEWPSLLMWPSNRAVATSTQWRASQATLKASPCDSTTYFENGHTCPAPWHETPPGQSSYRSWHQRDLT